MDKLAENTFRIKRVTKKWLLSHGFHYSKILSDEDVKYYAYRFPVYEYHAYITLECEVAISPDNNEMILNVYDYNTRDRYAPFYFDGYGDFDIVLKKIWSNIYDKLNSFNIDITKDRKDKKNMENKGNKKGTKQSSMYKNKVKQSK